MLQVDESFHFYEWRYLYLAYKSSLYITAEAHCCLVYLDPALKKLIVCPQTGQPPLLDYWQLHQVQFPVPYLHVHSKDNIYKNYSILLTERMHAHTHLHHPATCTDRQTDRHTLTHTCTHTHTHTLTHTHTHTHAYTQTYSYTCTCTSTWWWGPWIINAVF